MSALLRHAVLGCLLIGGCRCGKGPADAEHASEGIETPGFVVGPPPIQTADGLPLGLTVRDAGAVESSSISVPRPGQAKGLSVQDVFSGKPASELQPNVDVPAPSNAGPGKKPR